MVTVFKCMLVQVNSQAQVHFIGKPKEWYHNLSFVG